MSGYTLHPVPPVARMVQPTTERELPSREHLGLMRKVDLTEVERLEHPAGENRASLSMGAAAPYARSAS